MLSIFTVLFSAMAIATIGANLLTFRPVGTDIEDVESHIHG